jgi:hypothetical protein
VSVEGARALARGAFFILLERFAGSLSGEERARLLESLGFSEEEIERLEEERRLRWALRSAFIPPPRFRSPREGAETRVSRNKRKWARIERKVRKFAANPSLLKDLALLAFKLAESGYFARVRVVRVRDLKPAKLLPPFLLKPLSEKIARLELEISRD